MKPEEVAEALQAANKSSTGFGALAMVIRIAQISKVDFYMKNPDAIEHFEDRSESRLARKLKRNIYKRFEEVFFNNEMVNCIKNNRKMILAQLIEEDNFFIKKNSIRT